MSTQAPESQEFFDLVQRTSRYLRRHTLLIGSVLVLLATIGWLTCAVAVDLLMPLPTAGRVSFAAGFWLLLLGTSATLLGWPALRRVKLEDVALGIERTIGGMHNRLLTMLDLHRADKPTATANPEMLARLIEQTRARLAGFRRSQLVNRAALQRSLSALGGTLLAAAVLLAIFWDRAPTALARILRPTADIAPVTWLRIEAPGDLQVAYGDPLTIAAEITRGAVAELALHLQQPDGRWVTYPMQSSGPHGFSYTLNGITADYRYKISGGGTWTAVCQIRQVPRPVIEALTAAVRLPGYMERDELLPVPDDAKRIEAPLDSHIVLTATVSGDVAGGEILLLKRNVSQSEQVQEEEHVWFEDDLPADAATEIPWRWSTAQVHTGLRAFSFGRGRQPFGFMTRLNPLHVPADAAFYFYVWLDPSDPLSWLSIRLETGKHSQSVEWGEPPAKAGRDRKRAVYVGPLPEPGRWTRLEVPASRLEVENGELKIGGLSVASDGGQAFFDRPGFLTRRSQNVETVRLQQVAEFPLIRDEASGSEASKDQASSRWSGQVPVEGNGLCTVRFHSSLQQTSAEREPLEIVATKDQPPVLVVEKPAQDVTLPEPQPLHVIGRALDDWGLEKIGIQIGPSATTLGPARWQPRAETFAQSVDVLMTIDPQAEHLSPGESLFYCLVAKDCRGQVSQSATYRLSIATPDKATAPETAKNPESLDKLIESVDRLAEADSKEKAMADFLKNLPPELRAAVDEKGRFKKPDGSDMKRDEVQKLVGDVHQKFSKDQRRQLTELTAELNKRQQDMQQLADKLNQAATETEKNPLATRQEAEMLKGAAEQAAEMARQLSPPTISQKGAADLERAVKTERLTADHPQQLARLEEQLRRLEAARKQQAGDPQLAREMLEAQAAEQQAAAAARQLRELAKTMQAREEELAALEAQEAALSEQGKQADGKHLDALSKQQTEVDKEALAAIDGLHRDLGRKPTDEEAARTPWTAPGKQAGSPDDHKDATDKAAEKAKTKDAPAVPPDQPETKRPVQADASEKENSWDQPIKPPAGAEPPSEPDEPKEKMTAKNAANENPQRSAEPKDKDEPKENDKPKENDTKQNRAKEQDKDPDKEKAKSKGDDKQPENAPPPRETPRQRLAAHQDQMRKALADSAQEARKAAQHAQALADKLNQQAGKDGAAPKQPMGQAADKPPREKESPTGPQAAAEQLAGKGLAGKEPGREPTPTGPPPASQSEQASSSQPAQSPGQAESASGSESQKPSAAQLQQSTQALKDALSSPEVRQALAMAARANARSQSQETSSNQPGDKTATSSAAGPPAKTAVARPGQLILGEPTPLGSDPRERAELYKLPPRVREPLLEGMQEKGPEGYQPLIDAYFRELSKEIK